MDGKFSKEQFKKAKVADQIMMLYSALQYEKEFIRNALLGLAGDHLKAAKGRKIIHDKIEDLATEFRTEMTRLSDKVSNNNGSTYVLIFVVVALIGAVFYTAR